MKSLSCVVLPFLSTLLCAANLSNERVAAKCKDAAQCQKCGQPSGLSPAIQYEMAICDHMRGNALDNDRISFGWNLSEQELDLYRLYRNHEFASAFGHIVYYRARPEFSLIKAIVKAKNIVLFDLIIQELSYDRAIVHLMLSIASVCQFKQGIVNNIMLMETLSEFHQKVYSMLAQHKSGEPFVVDDDDQIIFAVILAAKYECNNLARELGLYIKTCANCSSLQDQIILESVWSERFSSVDECSNFMKPLRYALITPTLECIIKIYKDSNMAVAPLLKCMLNDEIYFGFRRSRLAFMAMESHLFGLMIELFKGVKCIGMYEWYNWKDYKVISTFELNQEQYDELINTVCDSLPEISIRESLVLSNILAAYNMLELSQFVLNAVRTGQQPASYRDFVGLNEEHKSWLLKCIHDGSFSLKVSGGAYLAAAVNNMVSDAVSIFCRIPLLDSWNEILIKIKSEKVYSDIVAFCFTSEVINNGVACALEESQPHIAAIITLLFLGVADASLHACILAMAVAQFQEENATLRWRRKVNSSKAHQKHASKALCIVILIVGSIDVATYDMLVLTPKQKSECKEIHRMVNVNISDYIEKHFPKMYAHNGVISRQ